MKKCALCHQRHITWERPTLPAGWESGYVCDYRLETEHFHRTETAMRACPSYLGPRTAVRPGRRAAGVAVTG